MDKRDKERIEATLPGSGHGQMEKAPGACPAGRWPAAEMQMQELETKAVFSPGTQGILHRCWVNRSKTLFSYISSSVKRLCGEDGFR